MLEKHKPDCRGINQAAVAIEMPKPGTKISFDNQHKQLKAPYIIYADFKNLIPKIEGPALDPIQKRHPTNSPPRSLRIQLHGCPKRRTNPASTALPWTRRGQTLPGRAAGGRGQDKGGFGKPRATTQDARRPQKPHECHRLSCLQQGIGWRFCERPLPHYWQVPGCYAQLVQPQATTVSEDYNHAGGLPQLAGLR